MRLKLTQCQQLNRTDMFPTSKTIKTLFEKNCEERFNAVT